MLLLSSLCSFITRSFKYSITCFLSNCSTSLTLVFRALTSLWTFFRYTYLTSSETIPPFSEIGDTLYISLTVLSHNSLSTSTVRPSLTSSPHTILSITYF